MIQWTEQALERLLAEDPGGPVVMLNLLRYRPDGGRESSQAYVEHLGALGSESAWRSCTWARARRPLSARWPGLGHGGAGPLPRPSSLRRDGAFGAVPVRRAPARGGLERGGAAADDAVLKRLVLV